MFGNLQLRPKSNEGKDLRIEHLTELVLKRNKMLFGQKSEKGKCIRSDNNYEKV